MGTCIGPNANECQRQTDRDLTNKSPSCGFIAVHSDVESMFDIISAGYN